MSNSKQLKNNFDEFSNVNLPNNLDMDEVVEVFEHSDNVQKVSMKPHSKVWNEVFNKLKYVSKPKKSIPYLNYLNTELEEIYGEQLGYMMFDMTLQSLREEYFRLTNEPLEFNEILQKSSLNSWRKILDKVNEPFSSGSGVLQFLKESEI